MRSSSPRGGKWPATVLHQPEDGIPRCEDGLVGATHATNHFARASGNAKQVVLAIVPGSKASQICRTAQVPLVPSGSCTGQLRGLFVIKFVNLTMISTSPYLPDVSSVLISYSLPVCLHA